MLETGMAEEQVRIGATTGFYTNRNAFELIYTKALLPCNKSIGWSIALSEV